MPDPWTLPDDDALQIPAITHRPVQAEPKTLLLLPFASALSAQLPSPDSTESGLNQLLAGMNLDTLQLRPARKIAKLLNISQKSNSKDKPLGSIRAQIKNKLQQAQELPAETLLAVRRELIAG